MHKSEYTLSKHHRRPRSLGGDNSRENLVTVLDCQHRAWHKLFDNYDPHTIARIINTTWLDPRYELVVRERRKTP